MALLAALVASEVLYVLLARLHPSNGWPSVGRFLALFALLFGVFAAAHAAARRMGDDSLPVIAAGAVMFRLTLVPAGLAPGASILEGLAADLRGREVAYERFLLFDNDVWRYLWEGHVAAHGRDPFVHAPDAPALDSLADPEPGPSTDGRTVWSDLRDRVNHPHVPAIYPPLAQASFALVHDLAPGSVAAYKLAMIAADLGAALLIAQALRGLGRPVADVLLYAWNPLVVKEFAGSAHVDALAVLCLAAMACAAARGSRRGLGALLGVAVLAKLSPLILVPLVARYAGAVGLALATVVVAAGYAPWTGAGAGLSTGLAAFARDWEFNAGPFRLLRAALAPLVGDSDSAARVMAAVLALGVAVVVAWRTPARPESFAGAAAWTLGALLILAPAVMPWYVTWLLPFAVVAGHLHWIVLSGLAGLAFLVMVDGTESAAVLAIEYGLLALAMAYTLRRRPRRRAAGGAMRNLAGIGCLVALVAAAPAAEAQGSGSTAGSIPGSFTMLRDVDGVLVSVDGEEAFTIEEKKTGEKVSFKTDEKVKLKADGKSALGGRSGLKLADFPAGHPVRVTYRTTDKVVVELKLKKKDP